MVLATSMVRARATTSTAPSTCRLPAPSTRATAAARTRSATTASSKQLQAVRFNDAGAICFIYPFQRVNL